MADNNTKIIISAEDRTAAALNSIKTSLGGVGSAAAALGVTLSVAGFAAFIKSTIDAADNLNDLSQRVGVGIKELAGYKLAAEQSGASLEAVARGVKGLATYMVEHTAELKKAGITAKDTDGAMTQLADVFAGLPDGIEKSALATKLFGKAGIDLIPMLNLGSKGLQEAKDKADEYGRKMAELAPFADAFNDQLTELSFQAKTLGLNFSGPLVDGLQAVLVLGGNVAYVLKAVGTEIGGIAAQIAAAATGDFAGFSAIGDAMKSDAKKSRADFDAWENKVMNLGRGSTAPSPGLSPGSAQSAAKTLLDQKAAADAAATAYAGLMKSLREKLALEDAELANGGPLNEAQKLRVELEAKLAEVLGKITPAQRAKAQAEIEEIANKHELNKANADWLKFQEDAQKANLQRLTTVQEAAQAAEDEVATYGLGKAAVEGLTIARLEEARAIVVAHGATADQLKDLDAEIAARKRIQTSLAQKDVLDANAKAAEEAKRAWERITDDVNQSLADAIMNGGMDGGELLKRYFKTLVLTPTISAIMSPISAAVGSAFGFGGAPGSAGASGLMGAASGASNLYSLLSAGQTQYNAAYGAFASSGIGQWAGLSTATSAGYAAPVYDAAGNLLSAGSGTSAGGLTTLGQSAGQYLPYAGALLQLAQGDTRGAAWTAGGAAIGSIIPGIGTAVGAVVGSVLGSFIGGGNKEDPHNNADTASVTLGFGRTGVYGTGRVPEDGAPATVVPYYSFMGQTSGSGRWGDSAALGADQIAGLNTAVAAIYSSAADLARQLGVSDAAITAYTLDVTASVSATEGIAGAVQKALDQLSAGLVEKLGPALQHLALSGETAAQTMTRVLAAMQARNALEIAIDNSLGLLNGSLTEYDINLKASQASMAALNAAIDNTADVQKKVDLENQLFQAVSSRYNLEKQYLEQLRASVGSAMADLARAQSGSASAREHILGSPIKSAADLRTLIASATAGVGLPSTAGVADAQTLYSAAQSAEAQVATLAADQATLVASVRAGIDDIWSLASRYGVHLQANAGDAWNADTARFAVTDGLFSANYNQIGGAASNFGAFRDAFYSAGGAYDRTYGMADDLSALKDSLDQAKAVSLALGSSADASAALAEAQQALSDALTAYAGDATKAADTLANLRDETLRYYDTQAQLADLMHSSASALGSTVTGLYRANMIGTDRAADQLAEFRNLYDSAAGLDGAALAGRADQLNSLAQAAVQSAREAWASGPEFQGILSEITGDLSALQTRLDAAAPQDYQAESLALLSGIDLSLSQLQDGLATADSLVVDAINGSKDATVSVLQDIRDKLDKLITVSDRSAQERV